MGGRFVRERAEYLAARGLSKIVACFQDKPRRSPIISGAEMRLTNRLDLPEAIVDAVCNDGYSQGDADISVTGLLRSPRMAVLERRHRDEITEDASDRIWALMGQSIHAILERANKRGIAERRLSVVVNGWNVSGVMDLYDDNGTLSDYKVTSTWKLVKGDLTDWEKQLNLYAVLLRENGHPVQKVQVVALLRDWSKPEASRDPAYPQAQVVNVEVDLWDPGRASAFMRERVVAHQRAMSTQDLPECTPEERWARPDTWAVMKAGRERAVKLHETKESAQEHVRTGGPRFSVQYRPGDDVRCEIYCLVKNFCDQYQRGHLVGAQQNKSTGGM